jgi:hypothetical protein
MHELEQSAVLNYLRSYLGSARCGLVDARWSSSQQEYGNRLLNDLFSHLERETKMIESKPSSSLSSRPETFEIRKQA